MRERQWISELNTRRNMRSDHGLCCKGTVVVAHSPQARPVHLW